jgi:hypothetical protein
MRTLDNFIDPYPKDGGCDEGPSYWGAAGAAMYVCLEYLYQATDGKVDVFDEPLVAEIGRFIYRVHIADRYFINFADAPALVAPYPVTVYCYGKRIRDEKMAALGAWAAHDQDTAHRGFFGNIGRQLVGLEAVEAMLTTAPIPPLPRDVWLSEIEVMVARDAEGSTDGLFLAVKGGHNAESHNHNDVGNLVVYRDGKPVLVDAGVESYTAKTFSSRRYEIWTMQSDYHNLPTVNGFQQLPGRAFAARNVSYSSDDDAAEVTMNLAHAYPVEAGIRAWKRAVRLTRGREITLTDEYALNAPPKALALNLLTACDVVVHEDGHIALNARELADGRMSGAAAIAFDPKVLSPSVETVTMEDNNVRRVWGERLTRLVFHALGATSEGSWTLRITQG